MRFRFLVCSACVILGSSVLARSAAAQQSAAPTPSAELLAGIGVGWRENPFYNAYLGIGKPRLRALIATVAIRPPARRLVNVEAELGWWQEETARFGTSPDAAAITTHLITFGGNLFLLPRLGSFRPRAGVGLHLAHHFDTGTHPLSETLPGANAAIGGELDLSPRLGAYALVRTERAGTATFSRIYGGVRVGLGQKSQED